MDNLLLGKHLRNSLNHLYDLDYLRQSPLVSLFQLSDRFDPAGALQKILHDTITELRPDISEPRLSEKRKIYEILHFRYVQQFKQNEVAHHIGMSERQFRREQDQALVFLASLLSKKFQFQLSEASSTESQPSPQSSYDDWNWLKETHSERVSDLGKVIGEIIVMMEPVALRHQSSISYRLPDDLPDLVIHPVAFRQIILNLLQLAIQRTTGIQMFISGERKEAYFLLRINHISGLANPVSKSEQEENLARISGHLASLCSCRLDITDLASGFEAHLSIPIVDSIPVLAVDDNPEILELLNRYSDGTRYQVNGTSRVDTIIEQSINLKAKIIVLDVMMPHLDGWELLGRIRNHPLTTRIPVIVLTILPQEELAISLGAHALVVKPVTQERFLAALDEAYASTDSGTR